LELDLSSVPGSRTLTVDTASLLFRPVPISMNTVACSVNHSVVIKRPAENDEASTAAVDVTPVCKVPKLADNVTTTVVTTSCETPGMLCCIYYIFMRKVQISVK